MENVRNDNLLSEFLWASAKQCVDYIKLWDCIPEKYNHLCKKYKVRSELLQAKYPIMPKSFINILLNEFRKINDNCGYMEIYVKNCCLIQLPSSLSIERKTIWGGIEGLILTKSYDIYGNKNIKEVNWNKLRYWK